MDQGGLRGDPGVLHDLIEPEKHLCTISINDDQELNLSPAATGPRRRAKTVNGADPAHLDNFYLGAQKVTTVLWKLLQKQVDERPLEEAMWPVNVLIGGISPRHIPVAEAPLADLCKVSVQYP